MPDAKNSPVYFLGQKCGQSICAFMLRMWKNFVQKKCKGWNAYIYYIYIKQFFV